MIFFRLFEPMGADFTVYFEAAKAILSGVNPYHWQLFNGFPFNYPPTSLLFLWPLGLGPIGLMGPIWNILSLAALLLSIYVVYRKANLRLLALFFIFTVPFFPTKFNFGMGQINSFVLLFSVLGLTNPFFLAFATGIKFAPAIFILYYFINKDWEKIAKYLGYLVALVLLSFVLVPFEFQKDYFINVLPMSFTRGDKDWYYNQSLYGLIARTVQSEICARYFFYLLALTITVLTWWRGRKLPTNNRLAAVSCLYLIIHPIALQHYFGFAIIPLILLGLNRWTLIAYVLIAMNIKQPGLIPGELGFVLSHQFFGILLLWALALKILKPVWVVGVVLVYVLSLFNRFSGLG